MAATRRTIVHAGSSVLALVALVTGLEELAVYPIGGVLMTLAGMALSLYGVAGLCGVSSGGRE